MRMMKRAAVGILAAAMALSMLTACGGASAGPGSSGSTSTGGSSNPGSSSSSSASSNGSSSSSSSSTKDDTTKLPDGTEIKYQDTKTAKYNQEYSHSKAWYQKTESTDSSGRKHIYELAILRDSKKSYTKSSDEDGHVFECLYDSPFNYILYSDVKVAIKRVSPSSGNSTSTSDSETFAITSINKTTRIEDSTPYYTEVMAYKGSKTGKTMTQSYCFNTKGKLSYIITAEDGQEYKTHILDYSSSIPSSVIMDIPSDWEVYNFVRTDSGMTYTDASGRELTEEEINVLEKKIYKW